MKFLQELVTTWWGITLICVVSVALWTALSALLYKRFFKRFYDILLSGIAIAVFSPFFLILTAVTAVRMKGNPFFTQKRPGKGGKIFTLIKFRTMTCEKDENGNFLPDEERLTGYGRFLRKTSLDELPELFNIFAGHMSVIGPRPLLVEYLPLYNDFQRRRHEVRPGLTGLAQVNGRNAITWEEKFVYDVYYVDHISLWLDLKVFFRTVGVVLGHAGIGSATSETMEDFTVTPQKDDETLVSDDSGRQTDDFIQTHESESDNQAENESGQSGHARPGEKGDDDAE